MSARADCTKAMLERLEGRDAPRADIVRIGMAHVDDRIAAMAGDHYIPLDTEHGEELRARKRKVAERALDSLIEQGRVFNLNGTLHLNPTGYRTAERRIELVPLDAITIRDERRPPTDLTSLKESIRQASLLHPITVLEVGQNGDRTLVLIAGYRRLQAFRELGLSEIPARFWQRREGLTDDEWVAVVRDVENQERIDEQGRPYWSEEKQTYAETRRDEVIAAQPKGGRPKKTGVHCTPVFLKRQRDDKARTRSQLKTELGLSQRETDAWTFVQDYAQGKPRLGDPPGWKPDGGTITIAQGLINDISSIGITKRGAWQRARGVLEDHVTSDQHYWAERTNPNKPQRHWERCEHCDGQGGQWVEGA